MNAQPRVVLDAFPLALSPGPRAANVAPMASPPRRPVAPETPTCDRTVARVLSQVGLGHFIEAFRLEGITLELASQMDFATLKAVFPTIRYGLALAFLGLAWLGLLWLGLAWLGWAGEA